MIIIVIILFLILAALIYGAAMSTHIRRRVIMAVSAFLWSFLMFHSASFVVTLNHNIHYSTAAANFLDASIQGIEEGRKSEVLNEMKQVRGALRPTYENIGNFKELANGAAKRLTNNQAKQDTPLPKQTEQDSAPNPLPAE